MALKVHIKWLKINRVVSDVTKIGVNFFKIPTSHTRSDALALLGRDLTVVFEIDLFNVFSRLMRSRAVVYIYSSDDNAKKLEREREWNKAKFWLIFIII